MTHVNEVRTVLHVLMTMGDNTFTITDESMEKSIGALLEKLEAMRAAAKSESALQGRMPARLELRSLGLWKAVLAECVASFLYVVLVCGAAGGAGVGASTSAVVLATALASGTAVTLLTLAINNISGAHINPCVSVALCVRRRVTPLRAALYVAGHCGGAIAGAALLYGITSPGHQGELSASVSVWGGAAWSRMAAELLFTALVVASHGAQPLQLAAAYTACTLVSMPHLNPARSLGPAFVLSKWEQHWVHWAGPIAGAVVAAITQRWTARGSGAHVDERTSDDGYDDLEKAFPATRHSAGYCAAGPRAERPEPVYGGTKSLYCRSPPPVRHAPLHRSQSVYSKGAPAGPLAPLRPHQPHQHQNAHNAQREAFNPAVARAGPAGMDSLYGRRTEESQYGAYRSCVRQPSLY